MKRMKRALILILIFTTTVAFNNDSFSEEERKIELNAQGILAQVDRIFKYPRGTMRGFLKHIRPDGNATTISLVGYVSQQDTLFTFGSPERGDLVKVLYNLGGEDIWVYQINALKLFHKMGIDKYDEILSTNFSYIDMSNADFQSNYTAVIKGNASIKGVEAYMLTLSPISRDGLYGMLTLYVAKDRYIPLRVDFHDRDKAIFKFMTIAKVKDDGKRVVPIRYDMMNIRQGTVTIASFDQFDEDATFNKEIFRSEKLGE